MRFLFAFALLSVAVTPASSSAPPYQYVVGDHLLVEPPGVASTTINISVCLSAGPGIYPLVASGWHAMNRSRALFLPHVLFTPLLLITPTTTSAHWDTKALVRRWVLEGDRCDVYFGPGGSSTAVAISPLVDVPWLDPLSSSSELSNKQLHPLFSRAIPTDDRSSSVALRALMSLGWSDLTVIFEDDPYGRSLADGMVEAAEQLGGTVHQRVRIPQSRAVANIAEFTAALRTVLNTNVRVVFVAGKPLAPHFEEIKQKGYDRHLIFVFPEIVCSNTDTLYHQLRSAFCVSYSFDDPAGKEFFDWFKTRDLAADAQLMETVLGPGQSLPDYVLHSASLFHGLAHDTALHIFKAINAHATDPAFKNKTGVDALRSFISQGATGRVKLDEKGDRVSASAVLFNSNGVTQVPVGKVDANGTVSLTASSFMVLGVDTPRSALPSALIPVSSSSDNIIPLVVGLMSALAVLLLAVVVVFGIFALVSSRSRRSHEAAPKDEHALVFTDVESSTALWSLVPAVMSAALDRHHAIIRSMIAKHNGYEVKTIGDSFMVAFKSPRAAIAFAIELQNAFEAEDWGDGAPELSAAYAEIANETAAIADDEDERNHGPSVCNGYQSIGRQMGQKQHPNPMVSPFTPPSETPIGSDPPRTVAPRALLQSNGPPPPLTFIGPPSNNINASSISIQSNGPPPLTFIGPSSNNINASSISNANKSSKRDALDIDTADRAAVFRGLRIRIGGHFGTGTIVPDAVSLSYDYYGSIVNIASRVQDVGHGGQIIMTVEPLGTKDLRSVGPRNLSQVTPSSLQGLRFPPLRLRFESTSQRLEGSTNIARSNDDSELRIDDATTSCDEDLPGPRHLRSVLSALRPDERASVIAILGRRWHVPVPSGADLRGDPSLFEAATVSIGNRSGRALDPARRRGLSVSSPWIPGVGGAGQPSPLSARQIQLRARCPSPSEGQRSQPSAAPNSPVSLSTSLPVLLESVKETP